jgi:hypothetical protein
VSAADELRRAAAAAGQDVAELERQAADPDVIPDDEYEHQAQVLQAELLRARGRDCAQCGATIRANDPGLLIEVTGWHQPRSQGGQNHVLGRVETGRHMCGECAARLKAGLSPQQETLL